MNRRCQRWRFAGERAKRQRQRRVISRRRLAGAFESVGQEADGVVVLGVDRHQRASLARRREHFDGYTSFKVLMTYPDLALTDIELLVNPRQPLNPSYAE